MGTSCVNFGFSVDDDDVADVLWLLVLRTFFDGEAKFGSLLVLRFRDAFGFGEIFSASSSVAFGETTERRFGRCFVTALGDFSPFVDVTDALVILNSRSPLFVLPSDFKPSRNSFRHFS